MLCLNTALATTDFNISTALHRSSLSLVCGMAGVEVASEADALGVEQALPRQGDAEIR